MELQDCGHDGCGPLRNAWEALATVLRLLPVSIEIGDITEDGHTERLLAARRALKDEPMPFDIGNLLFQATLDWQMAHQLGGSQIILDELGSTFDADGNEREWIGQAFRYMIVSLNGKVEMVMERLAELE